MRSLAPVLTTIALAASLSAVAGPASAAGETCRGEAATLVGTPGQALTGTEVRDVIVTNGAISVQALGGDDLICVTGTGNPYVYAGAGNDVVDATAGTANPYTALGDGDDHYFGSAMTETVLAGTDETTDSGHDVIDAGVNTGTISDRVSSGARGQANPDQITGGLVDLSWLGVPTATSSATTGAGSFFRVLYPNGMTSLAIDTTAGTLSTGTGEVMALEGFANFSIRADLNLTSFRLRGSGVDESLNLWNKSKSTKVRIAMAGGDDLVTIGPFAKGSSLSGGDGSDRIVTGATSTVTLDLQREQMTIGTGKKAVRVEANSFEDATVASPTVRLTGTHRPNTLEVNACRATVRGLGGSDTITALENSSNGSKIACKNGRQVQFFGDGGNDTLVGSNGPDLLVGGPGRDKADGRKGRDTCDAEVRKNCEVRR